jgi:hypothetical protein
MTGAPRSREYATNERTVPASIRAALDVLGDRQRRRCEASGCTADAVAFRIVTVRGVRDPLVAGVCERHRHRDDALRDSVERQRQAAEQRLRFEASVASLRL